MGLEPPILAVVRGEAGQKVDEALFPARQAEYRRIYQKVYEQAGAALNG